MLSGPPSHHVEQVHPRLERTHHASCGLLEHAVGNVTKQMGFEFKIDDKIDVSLVPERRKCPCVCQVLEWSPFHGPHSYLSWSVQRDVAREAFLEWTKPDDEFGEDLSIILAADMCAVAPGNEQWVMLYVSYDCEKLVGSVGERRLLLMTRHVAPPIICDDPHVAIQAPALRAGSKQSSMLSNAKHVGESHRAAFANSW